MFEKYKLTYICKIYTEYFYRRDNDDRTQDRDKKLNNFVCCCNINAEFSPIYKLLLKSNEFNMCNKTADVQRTRGKRLKHVDVRRMCVNEVIMYVVAVGMYVIAIAMLSIVRKSDRTVTISFSPCIDNEGNNNP